jgi:hypothetical protein
MTVARNTSAIMPQRFGAGEPWGVKLILYRIREPHRMRDGCLNIFGIIAACLAMVGRTPRSAADALVGFLVRAETL